MLTLMACASIQDSVTEIMSSGSIVSSVECFSLPHPCFSSQFIIIVASVYCSLFDPGEFSLLANGVYGFALPLGRRRSRNE